MFGMQPIKIEVEVDTNRGQPKLIIIGLPSQTVSEAKERITAALLNCGIRVRAKRTIVNLAPADVRKSDSCFEIAIAAALLKEYGILSRNIDNVAFFGELALNGEIKPMKGTLPLVLSAQNMGFTKVVIPAANAVEVRHLKTIQIHPLSHFKELVDFAGGAELPVISVAAPALSSEAAETVTFADIAGQENAKRALVLTAAGGHNLLMVGPPGAGKSLLAQSIIPMLPPLSLPESTEISMIHSLTDSLPHGLLQIRPFRSPHHSISKTGLIGGGHDLHPGEISLAHQGVLFLDELNEFSRSALESLREPLEQGQITITRSLGSTKYPARFSLVAAANPCPCGFYGSPKQTCSCSMHQISSYQRKVSGPLRDRIDLHLHVEQVPTSKLAGRYPKLNVQKIQNQINSARLLQAKRYLSSPVATNASLNSKYIAKFCCLHPAARRLLASAADKLGLTTRSYFSVIRVAQTIADLENCTQIDTNHIAEALQYR